MSTHLLDANVLIALTVAEHEHHDRASEWFASIDSFAVCPVVEGALVRFLVRLGETTATARAVLEAQRAHPRYAFWPDAISYLDTGLTAVRGHRQVTDTYLIGLARHHQGRLATLDAALADRYPHACVPVPLG